MANNTLIGEVPSGTPDYTTLGFTAAKEAKSDDPTKELYAAESYKVSLPPVGITGYPEEAYFFKITIEVQPTANFGDWTIVVMCILP